MQQTPVMILAGGQATRMGGGDKPLMLWRDRPLIEWLLDDIRKHSPKIAINASYLDHLMLQQQYRQSCNCQDQMKLHHRVLELLLDLQFEY